MRLVVADTSPIYYLLSIDQIYLLPRLFGSVFVPDAVHQELCHPAAPPVVSNWVAGIPVWAEVTAVEVIGDAALQPLGAGERAAITLALSLHADLILIDERKGTAVALSKGFEVTGTLGVLGLAARHGLVDLADAFARPARMSHTWRKKQAWGHARSRRRGSSTAWSSVYSCDIE
jgi:predicted nucleic acid-binding protein